MYFPASLYKVSGDYFPVLVGSVPDPGSGAFLTPGWKKIRIWVQDTVKNILDHISENLITIFGLKILKFLVTAPDPGSTFLTRAGLKNSDPDPGSATLLVLVST
jgi:hypothetical protein